MLIFRREYWTTQLGNEFVSNSTWLHPAKRQATAPHVTLRRAISGCLSTTSLHNHPIRCNRSRNLWRKQTLTLWSLFYPWWPCQDRQIIFNHGYLYHVRNAWWVRSKHLHFEGDLSTPGVSVRVRITTYKHHTECMGTDDWPFVQSSHPCCRVMRMSGLIATTVSCLLCLLCFLPRST